MANFHAMFRIAPVRWIGLSPPYNAQFIDFVKNALALKAWDPMSKTWWTPEGHWPLIKIRAHELNLVPEHEIRRFDTLLYAKSTQTTHDGDPGMERVGLDAAYAAFKLTPNAPPALVELAYNYWRRQYDGTSGAGLNMAELNDAYEKIMGFAPQEH